jgi:hypothetical protein
MKKLNHFAGGNAFSCSHQDGYYAFFRRHAELLSSGKLPSEWIPENAIKATGLPRIFFGHYGHYFLFFRRVYEKIVQKKDPGNRENGVHGARVFTGIF